MDFLVQDILSYVLIYKYIALFAISFFAAFIIPIPSGSVLMAISAFASIGYFDIGLVVLISIIGNILGDNFAYFLSYKFGKKLISKIGLNFILKSDKFITIEDKFKKHPGFIIFASRFEVLSTLFVNYLSGLGHVSYRKYLWHEITGTIAQISLYSLIGFLFGYNLQSVTSVMDKIFLCVALILIILFITYREKLFKKENK